MAYTWARRNELAAQRLEMMGIEQREGVAASSQERQMGLGSEAKRAEWVRENDWFYKGTVGTTARSPGPYDSPQMARDYVKGFLYKGHQTPSRRAARDRFKDEVPVDWNLWRDFRLGYGKHKHQGYVRDILREDEEYFEEEDEG